MGLFNRQRGESGDTDTIAGIRQYSTVSKSVEAEATKEVVVVDFPTTNLGDYDLNFDEADITLAKELLGASREQLVGSAALYLAAAENGTDSDYSGLAVAYLMMANLRPDTTQPT